MALFSVQVTFQDCEGVGFGGGHRVHVLEWQQSGLYSSLTLSCNLTCFPSQAKTASSHFACGVWVVVIEKHDSH